jgi:hypothetical protein
MRQKMKISAIFVTKNIPVLRGRERADGMGGG